MARQSRTPSRLKRIPLLAGPGSARFTGLSRWGRWPLLCLLGILISIDGLNFVTGAVPEWQGFAVSAALVAATSLFCWWPAAAGACLLIVTTVQTAVGNQGSEFLYLTTATGLVVYTTPFWFIALYCALSSGLVLLASATTTTFTESGVFGLSIVSVVSASIGWALKAAHVRERRYAFDIARLEYERAQQVEAERARIADELHDIIAHDITLVSMHVRVLERVDDPVLRDKSLVVIRESADQALADIRRMLRTVKEDRNPELDAAPDSDSIDVSVALEDAEQKLAGLGAKVTINIQPGLVASTSVKQALVRVVREASTNIVKHAATQPKVQITLRHDEHDVWLSLTNTLNTKAGREPVSSSGYGLARLRERVTLLGGKFSWGASSGNWMLLAQLPRR